MHSKLPDSTRAAVAVSVAALITAAALFGSLAPEATALPVTGGITVQGPPAGQLLPR
ncbi:hypothetical protein [Streptomyces sp. SID5910]|uniref:hypothetical protein n=1 Tax=Streptomyces sp. SID5910 TaxID=2690312 RepID=UPI0019289365|nr:hypothetical protein [Streptomyces sp. SID5910]